MTSLTPREKNEFHKIVESESDINRTEGNSSNKIESLEVSNENVYYYDDMIYGNNKEINKPCKMGSLTTFLYFKGSPIFVLGYQKLSLALVYECFINVSFWMLYIFISGTIHKIIFFVNALLYSALLFCHLFIFFINPGIPPRALHACEYMKTDQYLRLSQDKKRGYFYCEICHIICPPEKMIEHCEECNICIEHYDHHCFWTGKCIGKNNKWAFYVFLVGSLSYIFVFFITILIWLFVLSEKAKNKGKNSI